MLQVIYNDRHEIGINTLLTTQLSYLLIPHDYNSS